MLSNNIQNTINNAFNIAIKYNHEFVTYDHLFLSLLHDKSVINMLINFEVDVIDLSSKLEYHLKTQLTEDSKKNVVTPQQSNELKTFISKFKYQTINKKTDKIKGSDLFIEMLAHDYKMMEKFLNAVGISREILLKKVNDKSENRNAIIRIESNPPSKSVGKTYKDFVMEEKSNSTLESFCTNLNKKVILGDIDLLVGREIEIDRTIEILTRRQKNNPILVGDPGVGKTAIAEGIAQKIVTNDIPDILKSTIIYSLDVGSLVAGTRYRGDFEERIKNLLEEIKEAKNVILFIDEIHNIIGAGSTNTASLDASNLMKPALARGEIKCIGATTFKEFNTNFSKDPALVRRFQKILIEEPNVENSINILNGLVKYYENYHNIKYSKEAIELAVKLSKRYVHDRYLPDKAIDLLDESGAFKKITKKQGTKKPIVSGKDMKNAVSRTLNIESIALASNDIKKLKNLDKNLKKEIFGQDEAISKICSNIKMSKAGLRNFNKPVGCFLFIGPTGTGKTELAKQLSINTNMELIRFDMSEYTEAHTISRLIGSPPGYAGYEKGGLLTDAVSKNPYSVVLFDEFEKANSSIYNLLLQIMDYGKLTDANGKSVNFAHSMIIMTANSGAEEYLRNQIGFEKNTSAGNISAAMKEVNNSFTPEFRNRLDDIIAFSAIDENIAKKIIEKTFNKLNTVLKEKNVELVISKKTKEYLLNNCFIENPKDGGARQLEKFVDEKIKQKIADEILFGKLKNGGLIEITIFNNEVITKYPQNA